MVVVVALINLAGDIKHLIFVAKHHGDRIGRLVEGIRVRVARRKDVVLLAVLHVYFRPEIVDKDQGGMDYNGQGQHHNYGYSTRRGLAPVENEVNVTVSLTER